jgi:hypothetical protein
MLTPLKSFAFHFTKICYCQCKMKTSVKPVRPASGWSLYWLRAQELPTSRNLNQSGCLEYLGRVLLVAYSAVRGMYVHLMLREQTSFLPIPVAARSKACTFFVRSNTGIMGSNPTQVMDVCLRLFYVCAGSGVATG